MPHGFNNVGELLYKALNIGASHARVEAQAYIAVRERTNRCEHARRFQGAARASGSRTDRKADLVKLVHERLTVCIQARKGQHMRQPLVWIAENVNPRDASQSAAYVRDKVVKHRRNA